MAERVHVLQRTIGNQATLRLLAQRGAPSGAGSGGPRRARAGGGERPAGLDAGAGIDLARTGGRPLPDSVRRFFEPRFGRDFGDVRIHTGARASESARALNASAYTIGREVVFGAGRYSPGTTPGKALLAPELTHVAQQRRGGGTVVQRAPDEDPGEIQSYVFVGNKRLSTDKEFARRSGKRGKIPGTQVRH